jgi:hypothetical protein
MLTENIFTKMFVASALMTALAAQALIWQGSSTGSLFIGTSVLDRELRSEMTKIENENSDLTNIKAKVRIPMDIPEEMSTFAKKEEARRPERGRKRHRSRGPLVGEYRSAFHGEEQGQQRQRRQ